MAAGRQGLGKEVRAACLLEGLRDVGDLGRHAGGRAGDALGPVGDVGVWVRFYLHTKFFKFLFLAE